MVGIFKIQERLAKIDDCKSSCIASEYSVFVSILPVVSNFQENVYLKGGMNFKGAEKTQ